MNEKKQEVGAYAEVLLHFYGAEVNVTTNMP
jgi:hypothetical protein